MKPKTPNNKQARHAVEFINALHHTGDYHGQPFKLRKFQEQTTRQLFGTLTGNRLAYRTLLLFLPRKQGKTEYAASVLLYCLIGRGKQGQEIYSAAADREQASRLFNAAASMIRQDEYLSSICEITESKKLIRCGSNSYQALSSEANTKHGYRPSVILLDEIHSWKSRDLFTALTTGFGATLEPLTIIISTAGEDRSGLLAEQLSYARKVADGTIDDPTYLSVLYCAEPDDDWHSETTWRKAMPALGDYCQLDFIRNEHRQAKHFPTKEQEFRTYYLNQTGLARANKWMATDKWDKCNTAFDPLDFAGHEIYCGLDLSTSTDWSSLVCVCPANDRFYCWPYFWIPLNVSKRREARDPALWRSWNQQGLVNLVEGDVLNHEDIANQIGELLSPYVVQTIAADRAYANNGVLRLRDVYGFNVEWFNQGLLQMTGPTAELETAILSQRLAHNGHPVFRQQIGHAVATLPDKNGNYQLTKGRSADKIDSVIALVMALAVAQRQHSADNATSVYDTRGIISI